LLSRERQSYLFPNFQPPLSFLAVASLTDGEGEAMMGVILSRAEGV
jgi:hypothetical protein